MNKKEAIEELRKQSWEYENRYFQYELAVSLEDAQETVSQIHEPQKPVVPKFVAEWIDLCKLGNSTMKSAITDVPDDVFEWLENDSRGVNFCTFASAWLDGYEVEKEQLYVVTDGNKLYLKKFDELNAVIIIDDVVGSTDYAKRYSDKTEAQKAADELGWFVKEVE